MSKIKVVLRAGEFSSFTSNYLEKFWRQFFDIEIYDSTVSYHKQRTLFVVWWLGVVGDDPWPQTMRDLGYKVVVDNLWEPRTFRKDFFWLEHQYSMRWNESLWWHSMGYSSYRPNKKASHTALMQMRTQKSHRDDIVECFKNNLPNMLWSYTAMNKSLPNDTDNVSQGQRYMHPSWYDDTYCSIVVETFQESILHASEKSYKPIAYYHPYMIVSVPGALSLLKEQDFETFDNIFDESYDRIEDFGQRLKIIKSNIDSINLAKDYDAETLRRLQHNHDLFFDIPYVEQQMFDNIVQPMVQYAET